MLATISTFSVRIKGGGFAVLFENNLNNFRQINQGVRGTYLLIRLSRENFKLFFGVLNNDGLMNWSRGRDNKGSRLFDGIFLNGAFY